MAPNIENRAASRSQGEIRMQHGDRSAESLSAEPFAVLLLLQEEGIAAARHYEHG